MSCSIPWIRERGLETASRNCMAPCAARSTRDSPSAFPRNSTPAGSTLPSLLTPAVRPGGSSRPGRGASSRPRVRWSHSSTAPPCRDALGVPVSPESHEVSPGRLPMGSCGARRCAVEDDCAGSGERQRRMALNVGNRQSHRQMASHDSTGSDVKAELAPNENEMWVRSAARPFASKHTLCRSLTG